MKEAIKQYLESHGFGLFNPKAVLFDMDGVIYDSMSNHSVSWHDSMKDFGLDMPYEGAYIYEGMRGVETIKTLARAQWHRELTDDEAQEMYVHKAKLFADHCQKTPARMMPGMMPAGVSRHWLAKSCALWAYIACASSSVSSLCHCARASVRMVSTPRMPSY